MKFWKSLGNPFLLIGQGFALGAVLFFASHSGSSEARAPAQAPAASLLSGIPSGR